LNNQTRGKPREFFGNKKEAGYGRYKIKTAFKNENEGVGADFAP
jgi:hypothetical protein